MRPGFNFHLIKAQTVRFFLVHFRLLGFNYHFFKAQMVLFHFLHSGSLFPSFDRADVGVRRGLWVGCSRLGETDASRAVMLLSGGQFCGCSLVEAI